MSLDAFQVAKERLWGLHGELTAGSSLSDEAVLAAVDELDRSLKTNCDSAAQGLFALVSSICLHRPRLVVPLMRRALVPLVYLGYERVEQVQEFVGWLLSQETPYLPIEVSGRAWLVNDFPHYLDAIQHLLDELIHKAEACD